jgi:hypothetical protein
MEGHKDWMEASKDESPVAPSNDQTQTTKAHTHTRIPLAALPPREGAAPAGTANKDAGYVGPACPINWLGESGQSEGAGRRAGGGEDWVAGKTGKGAEAGLTRAADIGDETPDNPTECAARPEDNAFMQKFLSDSRLARLSPDQPPRPAVAEISQVAAAAAATDDLHGSEREQMRSELGALEDALRFLELDLVSLMERSRDDLYEIDFWRCSAEDEVLAARRSLHARSANEADQAQHTGGGGARGGGGGPGGVPQLAREISTPKGFVGAEATGDGGRMWGGGGLGGGAEAGVLQNAAQLQVTATNNQVAAAVRLVPSASAQVAKMRQRGGASRVELQLMVAELESKLEERQRESAHLLQQLEAERAARRRAGDEAGSGEACGAHVAPVAAAAAEEGGLEEEEVPEDDGAVREMCQRLHTEKRALQRERAAMRREISEMKETLKTADSQLRRRNNEAVKDGRTITELQEAVVTLQQSLKNATGPPAPPSEDAAAAARGERAAAASHKPQLASAMSSNRVSKTSVKFLDGVRWRRGMRCVRLRVRRARLGKCDAEGCAVQRDACQALAVAAR